MSHALQYAEDAIRLLGGEASSPRFDIALQSMAVSQTVISAALRIFTKQELEASLAVAFNDRLSGVAITNISGAEGGASGQVISGPPNEIIEILEQCLQRLDDPGAAATPPLSSRITFSRRRSET